MKCPHCDSPIGTMKDGKTLIRVHNRTLVIARDGRVEINCGNCKKAIDLPLQKAKESALPAAIRSLVRRAVPDT